VTAKCCNWVRWGLRKQNATGYLYDKGRIYGEYNIIFGQIVEGKVKSVEEECWVIHKNKEVEEGGDGNVDSGEENNARDKSEVGHNIGGVDQTGYIQGHFVWADFGKFASATQMTPKAKSLTRFLRGCLRIGSRCA